VVDLKKKVALGFKAFPSHIRLTKPMRAKLALLMSILGVNDVSFVIDAAVTKYIEDMLKDIQDTKLRIDALYLMVNELRKREDDTYKARKSLLRSHRDGYLREDLDGDRTRNERILSERNPELGEAIKGANKLRAYYADKLAKTFAEISKLLEGGGSNGEHT
jgi:hypothetical protein